MIFEQMKWGVPSPLFIFCRDTFDKETIGGHLHFLTIKSYKNDYALCKCLKVGKIQHCA